MADVESRPGGRRLGARSVELRVAARLENLAMVRTLVAAAGTFEDLDLDAVADLRLAVDEACTRLIQSALPDSTLVVVVDPRDDEVVIEGSTSCQTLDVLTPGSFSWHVLKSLTDDLRTFDDRDDSQRGQVFGVSMTTKRASSLR